MDTKPHSELDTDSPDTDARIETQLSTADKSNDLTKTVTPVLAENVTDQHGQSRFFNDASAKKDNALDGFVADVTTIAQSQCEHATNYNDIETLVCRLPIGHCTFAAHDSLAPYSGPYPMALLARAFIIEKINGWDETALHDYLRTNPSLRRNLGFETLPDQSTFWRAWNHRFSEDLRDAIRECADGIVTAARACDVSLPERVTIGEEIDPESDDCPERQLLAQKTDEVWQQAKPFVCDAFAPRTGRFTRTPSGSNTPTWECARICTPAAVQPRFRSIRRANVFQPDRPIATRSASFRLRISARCFAIRRE
jgi:putative transposase